MALESGRVMELLETLLSHALYIATLLAIFLAKPPPFNRFKQGVKAFGYVLLALILVEIAKLQLQAAYSKEELERSRNLAEPGQNQR